MLVGENPGGFGQPPGFCPNDAQGLKRNRRPANGQLRVVGAHRATSDKDCLDAAAKFHCVTAGRFAGDPTTLGRRIDAPVESHRGLGNHVRHTGCDPLVPCGVQGCAGAREHARAYLYACAGQNPSSAPGMFGVGVRGPINDTRKARLNNGLGARRCASVCRARLQSNV